MTTALHEIRHQKQILKAMFIEGTDQETLQIITATHNHISVWSVGVAENDIGPLSYRNVLVQPSPLGINIDRLQLVPAHAGQSNDATKSAGGAMLVYGTSDAIVNIGCIHGL